MKIKNIFTITALSALILAGCVEPEKAAEDGSSKSETFLDVNGEEITAVDTVNENKEVKEDEEAIPTPDEQLIATYNKIAEHFSKWELPEEGILPKEHEAYDRWLVEVVAYENGYMFEKETKAVIGRFSEANAPTPLPTEEQVPGLVMGIISEVAGDITNKSEQKQGGEPLGAKDVGDILPFIVVKFEEIVKYTKQEDIAEISTEIIDLAKELNKELEVEVSEERLENLNIQNREMLDKIYLLNNAVEQVEVI